MRSKNIEASEFEAEKDLLQGHVRRQASLMAPLVKKLPENSGDIGDIGLISGSGRFSRERISNPLQYSCLENPEQRSQVCYSPRGHKESDMIK